MNKVIEKDYSISFIRFVSMCMIIICHMMQRDAFTLSFRGYSVQLAFWFNVGVQIFLIISGYLYGKKDSIDTVSFYKKSFPKILVAYYIFIIIMLPFILSSEAWGLTSKDVIGLLTFSGTVPGLGHLWYIPLMLFCYLLTPIIFEIVKHLKHDSRKHFIIYSLILLAVTHLAAMKFFSFFYAPWINCYIIGMLYSQMESYGMCPSGQAKKIVMYIVCLACIVFQVIVENKYIDGLEGIYELAFRYFTGYVHVLLGLCIFIVCRDIYNKIRRSRRINRVLDWSDKYSYYVYLTHHVFVQSAFGCVEYIESRWIALPLAVILSVISAILLFHVTGIVLKKRSRNV